MALAREHSHRSTLALCAVGWTLLACSCGGSAAPPALAASATAAAAAPEAAVPESERRPDPENTRLLARVAELEEQVAALAGALAQERSARADRETEWLRFNQTLASIDVDDLLEDWSAHWPLHEEAPEELPEPDPQLLRDRERAEEIAVSLRNLMRVEEFFGMDPLEVGTLKHGGVGPVIFRLLDDRGRLVGSVSAERLRLEASRAAHTVTMVLEDGFESRGGERVPFDRGVRRIVVPHVQPDRWLESLPELFLLEDRSVEGNDGLWDLDRVRSALNARLREDATGGFYHLRRLGGIRGTTLLDVQLSSFDENGRLARRLFADRMQLLAQDRGIQILLEDGAIVRGDETSPFLEGRFRIFLPSARRAAWETARLPGFWTPISFGAPSADDGELPGEDPPAQPNPEPLESSSAAPADERPN